MQEKIGFKGVIKQVIVKMIWLMQSHQLASRVFNNKIHMQKPVFNLNSFSKIKYFYIKQPLPNLHESKKVCDLPHLFFWKATKLVYPKLLTMRKTFIY